MTGRRDLGGGREGRRRFAAWVTVCATLVLAARIPLSLGAPGDGPPAEVPPPLPGDAVAGLGSAPLPIGTPEQVLDACNRLYDAGRYPEAAGCYESLVASGARSGHAWYDLGNTRYRLGQLGGAILAWRQAEVFLPRDGDLRANIETARKQRKDDLGTEESARPAVRRALLFWYDDLSPGELWIAAAVFNALLWAAAVARLLRRDARFTATAVVFGVLAVTAACGAFVRTEMLGHAPPAVVLAEVVPARSGRDVASADLFRIHEGAEVVVRDRAAGWALVELPDGRRGWVDEEAIGVVRW